MDIYEKWTTAPEDGFRWWQQTHATGASRRPFSARSMVQHSAMFSRFSRHLVLHGATVTSFGAAHIESFLSELAGRSAPGTSTALRYVKLLDRLCRHLVDEGVRADNPASQYVVRTTWPTGEPVPVFLDEAEDRRLQKHVHAVAPPDAREVRNRAVVALLHGTGITSAEIRSVRRGDIAVEGARPHVVVRQRGARKERNIPLPTFAIGAIGAWLCRDDAAADDLLFPLNASTGSFCEETLWRAVREALGAIGFSGPDMSPRVLRNTYVRRLLLAGRSHPDVSALLGLSSQRTVVRIRATIPPSDAAT